MLLPLFAPSPVLLCDEAGTGNGWYEIREKLGQTAGYLTDISRAWEQADKIDWTEATLSKVVGLQCRYALITASLNSLAANLPEELLIALVKKKVWVPEQGLAYALQIPDLKKKANTLTNLAQYLPSSLKEQALQKALAAARSFADERERAQALSAIAFPLSKLPKNKTFSLWLETLHELSVHARCDLLQDLAALGPVIFALGGPATVDKVVLAICDVVSCWR